MEVSVGWLASKSFSWKGYERTREVGHKSGACSRHGRQRGGLRKFPAFSGTSRTKWRRRLHDPLFHFVPSLGDPANVDGVGNRPLRRWLRPPLKPGNVREAVGQPDGQIHWRSRPVYATNRDGLLHICGILVSRIFTLYGNGTLLGQRRA